MSEELTELSFMVRVQRLLGLDERPEARPSALRAFWDRHPWALLLLMAPLGAMGGFFSALYILKINEYPSVSYGLFVLPAVLAGWSASRPRHGAPAGMTTLLCGVLGHAVGSRFIEYAQNDLEYRGWLVIGLVVGALLGFWGQRLRSQQAMRRVMAAAMIIGLLLAPVHRWYEGTSYPMEFVDPRVYVFDLCVVALVIIACRGLAPRVFALVISAPLVVIFHALSLLSSIVLWRAGGGI